MIIADNILKIETTFVIIEVYNSTFEVGFFAQIKSESQCTRSLNLEAMGDTDAKC